MGIGRIAGRLLRIRWSYWIAAAWFAGVGFYWWHRVPINPEVVIPLQGRHHAWGYTAKGDLVISHGRQGGAYDIQRTGGPVDIVSSTTGEVVAQRLKKGDYILAVSARHIAGADLEQIRVVELESGKTAFTLPASSFYPSAAFSFDGQRIAIARGREITMHAVETGEQLWNRKLIAGQGSPLSFEQTAQGRHVNLYSAFHDVLSVSFGFLEHRYIRAIDGQDDSRFGPHDHVDESRDGRLAIVSRGFEKEEALSLEIGPAGFVPKGRTVGVSWKDQFVYDLAESVQLWEMDGEVNWRRISPDSKEIWEFSSLGGRPTMRRWKAEDGTEIDGQDSPLQRKAAGGIASRDARYLLTTIQSPSLRAPGWLQTLAKRFGSSWKGDIVPMQEELVLIDRRTGGTRLVVAPTGAKRDGGWLENLTGGPRDPERFTTHHKDRITVYRFDAPRNWVWLAQWGIWPVLLVIGAWGWGAVSARRPLSHGR